MRTQGDLDGVERMAILHKSLLKEMLEVKYEFPEDFFRVAFESRLFNPKKAGCRTLGEYTRRAHLSLLVRHAVFPEADQNRRREVVRDTLLMSFNQPSEMAIDATLEMVDVLMEDEKISSSINKMKDYIEALLDNRKSVRALDILRRYARPRIHEMKNMGEVFTSMSDIDKLLDQFPASFWRDPDVRLLDPSAGLGGFLVKARERFMKGLNLVIPDEKERWQHITRRQLFAVEINPENAAILGRVLGYSRNILCRDALDPNLRLGFFDAVVGNPPFEGVQEKTTRRRGGASLWPHFVRRAFQDWMHPGSYLAMLLPPGWRKPCLGRCRESGLWQLMTETNTTHFIDMNNDAKDEMRVSIQYDLVVCQKGRGRPNPTTVVVDRHGVTSRFNLKQWPFLPNGHFDSIWKMMARPGEATAQLLYSTSAYDSRKPYISTTRTPVFRYPVVHSILKDGKANLRWSSRNDLGLFGEKKVILNGYGGFNPPILDADGEYGMSQNAYALRIQNTAEGRAMVQFFNRPDVKKVFNDLQWSTSEPRWAQKMFLFFRRDFFRHI